MPPHDFSESEPGLALPVKYLVRRAPIFVAPDATVAQAARRMEAARVSALLVATEPLGIITDRDLRGRVLAQGLGLDTAVRQVMTHPVKTLDSDMPVFAALLCMLENNIHHLALVEEGQVVGMITGTDLLHLQASSPLYLRRTLGYVDDTAALVHYAKEIAGVVQTLFRGGLGAMQIAQIVSCLNDALIKRLVHLAERALGPPPAPFAWIIFGSEGRFEQTLLTDQDNALVYQEVSAEAHTYFTALAKRVVSGLLQVGFPPCPGGYMATNWCQPLDAWQRLFTSWIRTPEPQALLAAAIFFDFRPVAGELSLAPLEEILAGAGTERLFITHMVRAALELGPPLGFFNRMRSHHGMVDVKKGGLGPIVSLARAGALAAGSHERSTLERLVVAGASGAVLSPETAAMLAEIFQFLHHIRLRQQLAALQANQPLQHTVSLADLSALERRRLKTAFVAIRQIQDVTRSHFSLAPL